MCARASVISRGQSVRVRMAMAMRSAIAMAAALVVEAALLNGPLHGSQHCLLVSVAAHGELAGRVGALDVVHALALRESVHCGKDLLLTITAVHSFDVNLQLSVATVALGVAVIVRHGFGVVRRVARTLTIVYPVGVQ